jgi:F0F1-type ATP synthase assembly protein I
MGPAADQGPSGAGLLGTGAALAAAVVVPLVIGIAIDGALRTGPVFLFVGMAVGIAAGAALFYARFRRYL